MSFLDLLVGLIEAGTIIFEYIVYFFLASKENERNKTDVHVFYVMRLAWPSLRKTSPNVKKQNMSGFNH